MITSLADCCPPNPLLLHRNESPEKRTRRDLEIQLEQILGGTLPHCSIDHVNALTLLVQQQQQQQTVCRLIEMFMCLCLGLDLHPVTHFYSEHNKSVVYGRETTHIHFQALAHLLYYCAILRLCKRRRMMMMMSADGGGKSAWSVLLGHANWRHRLRVRRTGTE